MRDMFVICAFNYILLSWVFTPVCWKNNFKDLSQNKANHHLCSAGKSLSYSEDENMNSNVVELKQIYVRYPKDVSTCSIQGALYLSRGLILLTDYDNLKLKLITDDGQTLDELLLPDRPLGLCRVDENRVAITRPDTWTVSLVEVTSSQLTWLNEMDISTEAPCCGIAHNDGAFLITTGYDFPYQVYCIRQYSNDDQGLTTVVYDRQNSCPQNGHERCLNITNYNPQRSFNQFEMSAYVLYRPYMAPLSIAYDRRHGNYVGTLGRVGGDAGLYRLSKEYEKTSIDLTPRGTNRIKINGLDGIDVDDEGNIFLCGTDSRNVVRMSNNGNGMTELLKLPNDISKPVAISLCGDKFVLTSEYSDYISIYQFL